MSVSLSRAACVRTIPFAVFVVLLALRGAAPDDGSWGFDPHWVYAVTVVLVGGLMFRWRREYGELARQLTPSVRDLGWAVLVGLVVFVLWITLTAPWMQLGEPVARYVPLDADGDRLWTRIVVRWIGATLLVPVMEELFWRSFLMRWIDSARFETVDPQRASPKAIVLSTFVFTLAHTLWLAAAIAGLAYAWLYRRTGRLWVSVLAHAVTNGVLGAWVVATGNWSFW
jgi:CAAX prenyl protease-like protein